MKHNRNDLPRSTSQRAKTQSSLVSNSMAHYRSPWATMYDADHFLIGPEDEPQAFEKNGEWDKAVQQLKKRFTISDANLRRILKRARRIQFDNPDKALNCKDLVKIAIAHNKKTDDE